MTAILVAGLGLLVYGMVAKTASLGEGPGPFGTVEAAVPAGATVRAMRVEEGLVYLHLASPAGESLLVLHGRTGRQVGEVRLVPSAP